MTLDERNNALKIVLVAISPIAAACLAASAWWSVDAMSAGAPVRLLGFTPSECPGCLLCGMSRAFTAMSHGEFSRAVEFNPLVVLAYPAAWALVAAAVVLVAHFAVRRLVAARN